MLRLVGVVPGNGLRRRRPRVIRVRLNDQFKALSGAIDRNADGCSGLKRPGRADFHFLAEDFELRHVARQHGDDPRLYHIPVRQRGLHAGPPRLQGERALAVYAP